MADPAAPLVGADAEEERTRRTYLGWAEHAVGAAQRLAAAHRDDPEARSQVPAPPPPPAGGLTRTSLSDLDRREPDPARVRAARDAGWLLTADDAAAPGPPADGSGERTGTATGPLSGLWTVVKDVIDVAGLPTHNGTPGGAWRTPAASASSWRRLADAGARCLGKSATHEMAWGVTTPQIEHPFLRGHLAGGSSGGTAACVAAGVVPAGLGTDTGGSVRIPAALCGVVGIRPTSGAVPGDGVTPLAVEQDVVGPVARDVPTALAVLEELTGRPCTPADPAPAGLRVGVLGSPGRLDPVVRDAYEETVLGLERTGVEVVRCDTDVVRSSAPVSLLTMLLSSAREHARAVLARPDAFGSQARALLTLGSDLQDHADLVRAARRAVRASTAQLFSAHHLDAFLTPATPCPAPLRGADVDIDGRAEPVAAALTRFCAWAAVAGLPAFSVPTAVPVGAPPVGVQVVALPHHEHVCARLALAVERTPPA